MVALGYIALVAAVMSSITSTIAAPVQFSDEYEVMLRRAPMPEAELDFYEELIARGNSPSKPSKKAKDLPKHLSIRQCAQCPSNQKAYDKVLKEVEKYWKSGGFQAGYYDTVEITYGSGGIAQCSFSIGGAFSPRAGGAVAVRV